MVKKILVNPTFKAALSNYQPNTWLFDGKSLAWSSVLLDRGELRVKVNLDENSHTPNNKPRTGNEFFVIIRQSAIVDLSVLQGYLDRKIQFSSKVQEALNFIDHLIRQGPSQHLLSLRRNFYRTGQQGRSLRDGNVAEVHKGIYASVRLSQNLKQGGVGLALNADIANTCFWIGNQTVSALAVPLLGVMDRKYGRLRPEDLHKELRPVKGDKGRLFMSEAFKHLRRMRKLKFTIKHANRPQGASDSTYTIMDFLFGQEYGPEGANARNVKFPYNGKQISIEEYYATKYKAHLRNPFGPIIDAGKGGYIPAEFAIVDPMQRYAFKLNPDQTAEMIKIAVTRPDQRKSDIIAGVQGLNYSQDAYLKHYGVEFDPQFARTEARLLQPPAVQFAQGGKAEPRFAGRWDLRGKKFWKQNAAPLDAWGFIAMDNSASPAQMSQFARTFRQTFLGHGGKSGSDAIVMDLPGQFRLDPPGAVAWAHAQITEKKGYTQLLFVVVEKKGSKLWERIKKSCDCRFGILSQCVVASHVASNNGQYHSNVAMKVSAKLGGATSRTLPPWKTQNTYFPSDRPTMMIGVDVSHAAPGAMTPSVAAMTMSIDPDATRYAGLAETNGYRVEMMKPKVVGHLFSSLAGQWRAGHGGKFPQHIIYMRDGVAEGQFAHVLFQEVKEIRSWLQKNAPSGTKPPKFTVIVATKRHHIRFFPGQTGDKNKNAKPGTIVEKEVTHPYLFDWYAVSHVAIQGTARPVHYHVIMDEMNMGVNELQRMLYHQCYSYARATTPVSLHPAVYYAHLVSNRARPHENIAANEKMTDISIDRETESAPLLPLGGNVTPQMSAGEQRQRAFIKSAMWFI